MYITKFNLQNYKSFYSTNDVELNAGINIITGQNNAGKTALLQALSLDFRGNPHKSSKTIQTIQSTFSQKSTLNIELSVSKKEIKIFFLNHNIPGGQFFMNQLKNGDINLFDLNNDRFFDSYFDNDINKILCVIENGQLKSSAFHLESTVKSNFSNAFHHDISKQIKFTLETSSQNDFSIHIVNKLIARFYCFKAERLNIGKSNFGINNILNSDASNLPEVLNILQGDKIRFERYNSYVRKIFPQIYQISIRPFNDQSNRVEIVVWNENPELERSDLVVPLSECGTGIGQVLAILYVILTSDIPKVIIIDEPNSFLHPGAAKKLIEILKEHSQHQFIISTHSPATIAASNPQTIHIVKYKNAESKIETVDLQETNNQQNYLAEIGAKLSDVFGADSILWVEGKTEEICFPKIIEKINGISLMGNVVLSVINTGDFNQKKNADLIFKTYEKLSTGKGLLPPAIGFFFDSEKLTKTEKEDLARKSKNSVVFTKRKMFENYLLNIDAIFDVLNAIPEISSLKITLGVINNWIEENKWEKKFINQSYISKGKNETNWLDNVDGAEFLKVLFSAITNNTVTFDKIKHSVLLCEWIIKNSFDDLKDIEETLSGFLKK
ncbi:AAA family ATPase [uncultured Flavobacterium sp.]|uniref:ATP-dependent nuclease n=1 Tax=uncultured Flavobacterium sp. TaxID=165435 RepID=UPI003082122A